MVFRYPPTGEGASGPWHFLAGRCGYIQADAANVFDRLFNRQVASAVEVGCWAHARRKFWRCRIPIAAWPYPIRLIRCLYGLEKLADLRELSLDERKALRRERSQPVLDTLGPWLVTTLRQEPPSSELARASGGTGKRSLALWRTRAST